MVAFKLSLLFTTISCTLILFIDLFTVLTNFLFSFSKIEINDTFRFFHGLSLLVASYGVGVVKG